MVAWFHTPFTLTGFLLQSTFVIFTTQGLTFSRPLHTGSIFMFTNKLHNRSFSLRLVHVTLRPIECHVSEGIMGLLSFIQQISHVHPFCSTFHSVRVYPLLCHDHQGRFRGFIQQSTDFSFPAVFSFTYLPLHPHPLSIIPFFVSPSNRTPSH